MTTNTNAQTAKNLNNTKTPVEIAFKDDDLIHILQQRGYTVTAADEKDPLPEQSEESATFTDRRAVDSRPMRAKPEPVPAKTNFSVCTTANALSVLWDRTADTLNDDELRWFTDLTGQTALDAGNLASTLAALAGVIGDDEASAPTDGTLSDILFGLSDRAEIISTTLNISNEATSRLKHPELYGRDSASAAAQGGAV